MIGAPFGEVWHPTIHLSINPFSFFRQITGFNFNSPAAFFRVVVFSIPLGQFFLADFDQLRAFLVFCQQRFQRQIVGFHRLDDGFEFLQRLLERRVLAGLFCPAALVWFGTGMKA